MDLILAKAAKELNCSVHTSVGAAKRVLAITVDKVSKCGENSQAKPVKSMSPYIRG